MASNIPLNAKLWAAGITHLAKGHGFTQQPSLPSDVYLSRCRSGLRSYWGPIPSRLVFLFFFLSGSPTMLFAYSTELLSWRIAESVDLLALVH